MSSVVVKLPAISSAYFENESMDNTVKLTCRQGVSIVDTISLLRKHEIMPSAVVGLFSGPPSENAVYVEFNSQAPVQQLKDQEVLSYRNKVFTFTQLGKQVLTLRLHWLPLYISDNLIRSVFSDYGTVLGVERASADYGNLRTRIQNGLRTVSLEVDEAQRRRIPHLLQFACGTSILVTIAGRPPLCLKCSNIGHVRRDCPVGAPVGPRTWGPGAAVSRDRGASGVGVGVESSKQQEEQRDEQREEERRQDNQRPVQEEEKEEEEEDTTTETTEKEDVVTDLNLSEDEMEDDGFKTVRRKGTKRKGTDRRDNTTEQVITDSFRREFPPQKSIRPGLDDSLSDSAYSMLDSPIHTDPDRSMPDW